MVSACNAQERLFAWEPLDWSILLMQDYFLGAALSTESLSRAGTLGSQIAAGLNCFIGYRSCMLC